MNRLALALATSLIAEEPPMPAARLGGIPDGPEGVRQTLELMARLARQYRVNPQIRMLAEKIIAPVAEKDFAGEAAALHAWVRDNVRYTADVNDVETLKTPDLVLTSRQGDCDDKSLLLAALLESVGHPARFVAISYDPDQFEHVYVETKVGSAWIPAETTEQVDFGWSPPNVLSKMVRHV